MKVNCKLCFKGVQPTGKSFIVTEKQVKEWVAKDNKNQKVLKLFSMGFNLVKNPQGQPDRWIINFNNMTLENASDYKLPFTQIQATLPIERENNRNPRLKKYWWKYESNAFEMRQKLEKLSLYFVIPRVSKWAIFIPASPQ